jgi:hypothetical protein
VPSGSHVEGSGAGEKFRKSAVEMPASPVEPDLRTG